MACSFCVGIQIRPATRTMPATPGVGAARRGAAHGSGPDGAAHGSGPDGGQGRRAERGAGPAGSARVALVVVSVAGGTYTVPDFAACALVTIDTQRDTLDGAPLEVAGTSAVLPAMRGLLEGFRRAGRARRPPLSARRHERGSLPARGGAGRGSHPPQRRAWYADRRRAAAARG